MAYRVSQNKEISGEGKDGERKIVGSAIHRRRANRGSTNIKESKRGGVFREMLTPT